MVKSKQYMITAWIESAVTFEGDVSLDGFHFTSIEDTPNGAIVWKATCATQWFRALDSFNNDLIPLLDALSMHRLSAISAYGKSVIVAREDLRCAMAILVDRVEGVGLYLSDSDKFTDHKQEIERIVAASDHSLYFFRHALLSPNALSIALNLLQCAESIVGVKPARSTCIKCAAQPIKCASCKASVARSLATNHEGLKELLGSQLYTYFYVRKKGRGNDSVRNKLMHGKPIRSDDVAQHCEPLLEKLKDYYRGEYDLKHVPTISGVRQLFDDTSGYTLFLRYTDNLPSPQELLKLIHDQKLSSDTDPGIVPDSERHELLNVF